MRDLTILDKYRMIVEAAPHIKVIDPTKEGIFSIPSVFDKQQLAVLCSGTHGWDHVSVSRSDRIPIWIEMEQIKRIFFYPEECVMQLHPPDKDYVTGRWPGSRSLFVLHLWKPHDAEIPRPPKWMVGANSLHEWEKIKRDAPE